MSSTFWTLAEPWLAHDDVTRGTMMGFPCLRRDGAFFACEHRATLDMIVKLPRDRVHDLIASQQALPFAPNGRVFREWAQIPQDLAATWPDRLDEAYAFAAG